MSAIIIHLYYIETAAVNGYVAIEYIYIHSCTIDKIALCLCRFVLKRDAEGGAQYMFGQLILLQIELEHTHKHKTERLWRTLCRFLTKWCYGYFFFRRRWIADMRQIREWIATERMRREKNEWEEKKFARINSQGVFWWKQKYRCKSVYCKIYLFNWRSKIRKIERKSERERMYVHFDDARCMCIKQHITFVTSATRKR